MNIRRIYEKIEAGTFFISYKRTGDHYKPYDGGVSAETGNSGRDYY